MYVVLIDLVHHDLDRLGGIPGVDPDRLVQVHVFLAERVVVHDHRQIEILVLHVSLTQRQHQRPRVLELFCLCQVKLEVVSLAAPFERHELFMTAIAAFAYVNLSTEPRPGYDIATLIAWDASVVDKTPDFVMDRNRNFEFQGDIHHAEINTMRKAYERRRRYDLPPSAPPKDKVEAYTRVLANTTLYTTLEPCPMCAMTMLLARVPTGIYFMEDPGLRDLTPPHNVVIRVPDAVYGRRLAQVRSTIKEAEEANQNMWRAAKDASLQGGALIIIDYLTMHGKDIFAPSFRRLQSFGVHYAQNAELYQRLKAAVGTPLAVAALAERKIGVSMNHDRELRPAHNHHPNLSLGLSYGGY